MPLQPTSNLPTSLVRQHTLIIKKRRLQCFQAVNLSQQQAFVDAEVAVFLAPVITRCPFFQKQQHPQKKKWTIFLVVAAPSSVLSWLIQLSFVKIGTWWVPMHRADFHRPSRKLHTGLGQLRMPQSTLDEQSKPFALHFNTYRTVASNSLSVRRAWRTKKKKETDSADK